VAGIGAPPSEAVDGRELRVGVVAARWHAEVTDALLAGARRALADCQVPDSQVAVIRVPGTFELPVVAGELAVTCDAVIALGVVIRGGTPHFEYVCESVTTGLTRVSLDHGTPVGFGVLTCDTEAQATDRAGLPGSKEDKGREAVLAALETALVLNELRHPAVRTGF
jgi:6,7-dimethyl-8-ribityllumazine synthase